MDKAALKNAVLEKLKQVIDPETGADVVRMKLIENLVIGETGQISYTFRPSSPLCPIAVPLGLMIIQAINEIEGITDQRMTVVDYIEVDKLNELFRLELENMRKLNDK